MFIKCLWFAVLIVVAAEHGSDSEHGDIPILPSPGFAWLLEFVLGG